MLIDKEIESFYFSSFRLFGFITRNRQTGLPNPSFACHVFECNVSAEEV